MLNVPDTAIGRWDALLAREDSAALCAELEQRMRAERLTFGGRLLCPFARPFFLEARDEVRVKIASETLWRCGERVAQAALQDPTLLADLALSPEEIALVQIEPGYATASTAGRADAFILPDSLQFAEYNAESPAGPGYSQRLAEIFDTLPTMAAFRTGGYSATMYRPIDRLLEALLASYREWGGTASPPQIAIVDWREVPTFTEFELLRDAFVTLGVPTIICDPRDLEYAGGRLTAGGRGIDLVYRRVLTNDIIARRDECAALLSAYQARTVCVANTLRCKIAHKKAFFAVLSDERRLALFDANDRAIIKQHVPWTALIREREVVRDGRAFDLIPHLRSLRSQLVIKPNDEYGGTGVTLGWEASESEWDAAISRALAEQDRGWVAQERINVRREPFPRCAAATFESRDMLIDFAPYLFRGRLSGFLTRLSSSGLANVTSGGGQVPAFVVASTIV